MKRKPPFGQTYPKRRNHLSGSHPFVLFESFVVDETLCHHEGREEHEDEGYLVQAAVSMP